MLKGKLNGGQKELINARMIIHKEEMALGRPGKIQIDRKVIDEYLRITGQMETVIDNAAKISGHRDRYPLKTIKIWGVIQ